MNYNKEQMRNRHATCISMADIKRDVDAGRVPSRFFEKGYLQPACSHPEDGFCASPSATDDMVDEYVEKNRSGLGRPRRKDNGE